MRRENIRDGTTRYANCYELDRRAEGECYWTKNVKECSAYNQVMKERLAETVPFHLPHLDVIPRTALSPLSAKKLRLARQEDISCLNSLEASNFR